MTNSQAERPTLLVVAPSVPAFDRFAGALRFFTMLRILAREYRLTFLGGTTPDGDRYLTMLTSLGVEFHDSSSTQVETLLPRIEAGVFFEFYHVAEEYLDAVRHMRPDLPIVVDSVDLHFVRESRALAYGEASEADAHRARETRHREIGVYQRADAVIVVTESDKRTLLECIPDGRIGVVPTIHPESSEGLGHQGRRPNSLLFVGGFAHSPNVDAVRFFGREILPVIMRAIPGVTVTIVGDAPPEEVRRLASSTVTVTGWVPDVKPYLDSHMVSIAPLRFGSGMKGKVGEAMAHGLPVVVTTVAAEGMDLTDGVTALIADSAPDFAGAVVRLLGDEELRQRLSRNGRQVARTRWSEAVVARDLLALMRNLAEVRPKRVGIRKRILWMARLLMRRVGVSRLWRLLRKTMNG